MSWLGARERGSLLGMRVLLWMLGAFGLRPARIATDCVALYFFATGRQARRASRDYLRRVAADPRGRAALAREPGPWASWLHVRTFAQMTLDRACFWRGMDDRFEIVFEERGLFRELLDSGRGGILLGAHVGNFDVLRVLALRHDRPIRPLMFQDNAPNLGALLRSIAPDLESRVIRLDPTSIASVLGLQAHVEAGDWIAILGDRKELASARRTVRVELLGAVAEMPASPLLVASALGCPVYLVFGLRTAPMRYEIVLEPFAERVVVDRENRERDLAEWVQRYARRVEAQCLRVPLQWFNFYAFWRDPAAPKERDAE